MYLGQNESVSSLHLSALGYDVSPRSLLGSPPVPRGGKLLSGPSCLGEFATFRKIAKAVERARSARWMDLRYKCHHLYCCSWIATLLEVD